MGVYLFLSLSWLSQPCPTWPAGLANPLIVGAACRHASSLPVGGCDSVFTSTVGATAWR